MLIKVRVFDVRRYEGKFKLILFANPKYEFWKTSIYVIIETFI